MNDPVLESNMPLIAQADDEHGAPGDEHADDQHAGDEHAGGEHAGDGHEAAEGDVDPFAVLLSNLGDHRELTIGPVHIADLPVILVDGGLHVYPNVEEMQKEGKYSYEHHKIVNAETHQPPSLDLSITSLVVFQWLAMLILAVVFIPMARKYKKRGARPLGKFHSAMESVVLYVRDQIVYPNAGRQPLTDKMLPIFFTFFFFILTMNLIGLVPGGHSATGNLSVTAALAIVAFFVIQGAAIRKNGFIAWAKHLTGGTPAWLWPIMIPVEILGLFAKPFALCVRLFANMTAGHVILLSLIGLSFIGLGFYPVTVGFSLFINLLELLVAFIQAYIFTILVAVFVGMGMEEHEHAHEETHALEH